MPNQPTGGGSAATIAEQLPAIQSLAALAGMLGHLPGAYITIAEAYANRFDVQTITLPGFEVWREALQVPAEAVELHAYRGGSWLEVRTAFHGTQVHLTSHGLLIDPDDAKSTPRQDAERRQAAALLVQRHEPEDAAVPPLAVAAPATPIEVRTLADAKGGTA